MIYRAVAKPMLDWITAGILLLITSPILLLTAGLLLIANKGQIWFMQTRPGKNEKLFNLLKFKTMNDRRDQHGILLSDDERLTFIGRWVRKTSVDELPQLINVLAGDMSIVGPRPLLKEYLPLYSQEQKRRHEVKPGITGWAQVNGRNTVEWRQRFLYDVWYVDHQSFTLDLKILFLTIIKVLKAEGISGEDVATMKKFSGN